MPWSVTAPNIDLDITNLPKYHGNAAFHGGIVQVQNDLPMWVNFKTQFTLDGPKVHLDRIDLDTDGARTVASGDVDFAHWPEQVYHVKSAVHFQRMREIFWKDEKWTIPGDGDFAGTFRLYKGGHELSGTFASPQTGVNGYPFSEAVRVAPLDAAGVRGVGRRRRLPRRRGEVHLFDQAARPAHASDRALRCLGVGRRPRVVHGRGEARQASASAAPRPAAS